MAKKIGKGKLITELVKGSLQYTQEEISNAFRAQFPSGDMGPYTYIVDTFADYIVVSAYMSASNPLKSDEYYKITYSKSGDAYTFAAKDAWEVVELTYQPQPSADFSPIAVEWYAPIVVDRNGDEQPGAEIFGVYDDEEGYRCPYGAPGDVLWVREAWDFRHWGEPGNPFRVIVSYGADGFQKLCQSPHDWNPMLYNQPRWRPSIHMPRWVCRIELEIVSVRAERVQEITRNDAKAEGANFIWRWDASRKPELHKRGVLNPHIANYSVLWDEINEKRGFGWNVNPFVWVIEFQRRGITQHGADAKNAPLTQTFRS